MENKRILWVNPSFLDYRIPLYKELNKLLKGNFHLIYSPLRIPGRCNDKIISALGANAHPLKSEKIIHLGSKSDFSNKSLKIPFPKGLIKLIEDIRPDIIIAEGFFQFTPWAVKYSHKNHVPLLIAYERTAHTERNCPKWRQLYRKFINKYVKGYIANGILTKEYLISLGIKSENIFTGGMSADSSGLSNSCSKFIGKELSIFRESFITKEGLLYIYVGQLIKRKGIEYLIHAWKEHLKSYPNDILLIVGSGDCEDELRKLSGNNSNIIFTGNVDYENIYKYYAISDVFVIPTLEDNWSLVVPEAMSCGLPIACSIYNGCHPELVHEGVNGTTFDPLNSDSFVAALSLFHNVNLNEFSIASKNIEKNFSPQETAKNILKALQFHSK